MITHTDFKKLRLNQFFPELEVTKLENWEFMENLWVGEAIGFSEWLCLETTPNELGSISLDLSELPENGSKEVLENLGLPLKKGMKITEIENILGEPNDKYQFTEDRKSYEFLYKNDEPYSVSCTVLNDGGLSYIVVMLGDGSSV